MTDGHVRYDRVSQRWFITQIDVRTSANHLLLAVSSSSDLSTTTWTLFQIPTTGATAGTDPGCFADYDTPGVDTNAIYVGANMFGGNVASCSGLTYLHSNLYVLQKSSALTSTLHFTSFFDVATGTVGVQTIQGVDSIDSMTTGYAVSIKTDENPSSHLNVWQINSPGTTSPTLSGPTLLAISPENGALGGVLTLNNVNSTSPSRPMDDIDDRLFAAEIRNGHLWTAHNIAVDSSGNSNGPLASLNRDAARWYDVTVSGLTLNQSGTVFDNAASGFQHYWVPTIAVSGQGDAVVGLNRANSSTAVQAGAVGRLASDPLGTMGAFSAFQNSSNNGYDDSSFNPSTVDRWGDFTYTSLDPCDDQTIWTAQEFVGSAIPVGAPVGWQVAAEKLLAPPPATPSMASPSVLPVGASSVNVVVTGTSLNGSGFYDTTSNADPSCRNRITATIGGGVVVNSITYTDPTHLTLNVSTVGATTGQQLLTITNPDGQTASATLLTVAHLSYFNWYDNASPGMMNDNIHLFDAAGTSAHVTVSLPGATPVNVTLAPGVEQYVNFPKGTIGGPVTLASDQPLLASQRVQYYSSFNEIWAITASQAAAVSYVNWFDKASPGFFNDNIHLLNPGFTSSNVTVSVPGATSQTVDVGAGAEAYVTFPFGTIGGPVKITVNSGPNVLASSRVQYYKSFNEVLGRSAAQAQTDSFFNWYDTASTGMVADNIHIVNPSPSLSATGTVDVPGQTTVHFSLGPGLETYLHFGPALAIGGPVHMASDNPVLATQRVQFYQSFNEVASEATTQALATSHIMWFDKASPGMWNDNIHILNPPGAAGTAHVTVTLGATIITATVAAGTETYVTLPAGTIGGPIVITSDQPILAAQRVQYYQSFNEVPAS